MPSDLQPDPPEPLPIYVGETDGALRLWLAHEAMRQAEQVLAGQTASLTALETRATTLLTWSATTALALSALALGPTHPVPLGPASIVGALLVATAGACGAALRPDDWHYPGFRLSELAARQHETPEGPAPLLSELEHCEWTAAALEHAATLNTEMLDRRSRCVTLAWRCLAGAAAAAVLALIRASVA